MSDTLTLSEWATVFKQCYAVSVDKYGRLIAVLMIPLYPYFAAVAVALAAGPPQPDDGAKIQAAKERQIDDWSELKS
jgi:hypothetical protein